MQTRSTSLFLAVSATLALAACGSDSGLGPTPPPAPAPVFRTGEVIALQSDTGKFLSRIRRGDLDPVEAEATLTRCRASLAARRWSAGRASARAAYC